MTPPDPAQGRPRLRRRGLALLGVALLVVAAVVAGGTVLPERWWSAHPQEGTVTSTPSPPQPVVTVQVSGRPMSVLFVGDSLTFGSYASTPDDTFRALVMKGVRHHTEATTSSIGGSGQTSAMATRFVRSRSYDLIVVETGTNDAAKERPELLRPSYVGLLAKVRRASPGAALVCVGSWLGKPAVTRVDDVIRSECRVAGGLFVPVDDLYSQRGYRGPAGRTTQFGTTDDFHPNDAGHRAIAERILGVVRVDKVG